MLNKSASKDRQIMYFQRPFNFSYTPYTETDFGEKVREYCSSSPVLAGLRITKAIVLGDIGVGKTSLVRRFCQETYDKNYKATIGVDFEVERFDILSVPFNMQIWDTAGQERFKCIASSYYRAAQLIVIVFDLSRLQTLSHCCQWLKEALEENKNSNPLIFLVGNKVDSVSEAAYDSIETFAGQVSNNLKAEYWSVSSKTGENVSELFFRMAALAFNYSVAKEKEFKTENVIIGDIVSSFFLPIFLRSLLSSSDMNYEPDSRHQFSSTNSQQESTDHVNSQKAKKRSCKSCKDR